MDKYTRLAGQPQFSCVGEVRVMDNGQWLPLASCVLISDRCLLSAAHCFIGEVTRDTSFMFNGMKVDTYVVTSRFPEPCSKFRVVLNGRSYGVKKITLYDPSLVHREHDLSVITLGEDIRNIQPACLNDRFDELGDTVTGVGFGVVSPGDRPNMGEQRHLKLAGENVIDSMGGFTFGGRPALMYADFDDPDTTRHLNRMGRAVPLPMEYLSSAGDSGGGLFRKRSGQWELIGICKGSDIDLSALLKTGYYGQVSEWIRISLYSDWIKNTIR
jgi:hypothetical protein